VKQATERGLVPGPRARVAVVALSQTGEHGGKWLPERRRHARRAPRAPDDRRRRRRAVRKATRALLRAGADQIKVHTAGGVMSPSDEPTSAGFSPEEIAPIVYEAHAPGRPS